MKRAVRKKFNIAVVILLAMAISLTGIVNADTSSTMDAFKNVTVTKDVDPATDTVPEEFGTDAACGKVWSDKTVKINADNYEVKLSALTQKYESTINWKDDDPGIAADVLLILDLTSSMHSEAGVTNDPNGDNTNGVEIDRYTALVAAANKAIDVIMNANPKNRVMVNLYGMTTANFMPLGHYTTTSTYGSYISPDSATKGTDNIFGKDYVGTPIYIDYVVNTTQSDKWVGNVKTNSALKKDGAAYSKGQNYISSTYTQRALLKSMDPSVSAETSLTSYINKQTKSDSDPERIPFVFLLTDGEANTGNEDYITDKDTTDYTYSSTVADYLERVSAATILTAKYEKDQLTYAYNNYNKLTGDDKKDVIFFTLGLGTKLDSNAVKSLLNPSAITDDVKSYLQTYAPKKTPKVGGETKNYLNDYDYVSKSSDGTTSYSYTTASLRDLQIAFNEFAELIKESTTRMVSPLTTAGGTDNVVFTDKIGSGMSVVDSSFKVKVGKDDEITLTKNATTGVYESSSLKDLKVELTGTKGNQTVKWYIPTKLLPYFEYDKTNNKYVNKKEGPITLRYDVAIEGDTITESLYTNDYTKGIAGIGQKAGTYISFTPRGDNPYYFSSFVANDANDGVKSNVKKSATETTKTDNITNSVSYSLKEDWNGSDMNVYLGNNGVVDPVVKIEKTATAEVGNGDDVDYTITVTNMKDGDIEKVVVKDILPSGISGIKDKSGDGISFNASDKEWTIAKIEKGKSVTIKFTATVDEDAAAGKYTNTAKVTAFKDNGTDKTLADDEQATATADTKVEYLINYKALPYKEKTVGSVTKDSELFDYEKTKPEGSTATPDTGYHFVAWYDNKEAQGTPVSTDKNFVPAKPVANTTYYALFAPNTDTKYTVEHYVKDLEGDGYTLHTTELDKKGTTGETATAKPISITGATYDKDNANDKSSGEILGDGSLVLKLYYDRNEYDVTYKYINEKPKDAADVPEKKTYKYGEKVTVSDEPSAKGYTFEGWDPTDESGITVTTELTKEKFTMPDNDVVIEGKWVESQAKITYEAKDGGSVSRIEENLGVVTGEAKGSTATPKPGYKLVGWYEDTTCTGDPISTDTTFIPEKEDGLNVSGAYYAKFDPKTDTPYRVEYYLEKEDGTGYELKEHYHFTGTTDTEATAEIKTYSGFNLDDTVEGTKLKGNIDGDGSLVLKLYYNRSTHNVTYSYSNEKPEGAPDVPDPEAYKYGKIVELEEEPSVPGYKFSGWEPTDESGISISTVLGKDGFVMPNNDVNLVGTWEENDIEINYVALKVGDETAGSVSKDKENFGVVTGTPEGSTATALEGYVFEGWYDGDTEDSKLLSKDANFVPTKPDGGFVSGTTYYAKFSPATNTPYRVEHYTKDLEGDGYTIYDAATENKTGTTGEEVSASPVNIPGFTYDKDNEKNYTKDLVWANGELVLKLYYDRNQYKVKYKYKNDKPEKAAAAPEEATFKYGQEVTVADEPYAEGYDFNGWTPEESSGITPENGKFTMPANDVLIVGEWDQHEVTLNYEAVKCHDLVVGTVDRSTETFGIVTGSPDGSTATAVTGYHFEGWYDNRLCLGDPLSENRAFVPTKPEGGFEDGFTYYAKFMPNNDTKYIVNHFKELDEGGFSDVPNDVDNKEGTTGTLTAAKARTAEDPDYYGYTAGEVVQQVIAPDGTTVINIKYTRNKYPVNFDTQGHGIAPDGIPEQPVGELIPEPEDPTAEHYEFGGWFKEPECINPWNFEVEGMPDEEEGITLYAKWDPVEYSIEYILDGGTLPEDGVNPDRYNIETETFTISNPEKEGHKFLGWTGTDIDPSSKEVTVPQGSSGDRTYTANWELETRNIEYSITNPEPTTPEELEFVKNIETPEKVPYGSLLKVIPNGGEWEFEEETYTDPTVIEVKDNLSINDPVRENMVFVGWELGHEEGMEYTLTALWEPDEIGPEMESDGIPDKYQKKVIFHIVNGEWEDGSEEEIVNVVTFIDIDGNLNKGGKAFVDIPEGMKPSNGFDAETGEWDEMPVTEVSGTDPREVIEYTFEYSPTVDFTDYFKEGDDRITEFTVKTGTIVKVDPNSGVWKHGNRNYRDITEITVDESLSINDAERDGYKFLGWRKTVDEDGVIVFVAMWEKLAAEEPEKKSTTSSLIKTGNDSMMFILCNLILDVILLGIAIILRVRARRKA